MAEQIKAIYDNSEKGKAMGEAGRKALHEKYDWNIQKRNLIKLYAEQKD